MSGRPAGGPQPGAGRAKRARPTDGCSTAWRDQRPGSGPAERQLCPVRSQPVRLLGIGCLLLTLSGCMGEQGRPLPELDRALEQAGSGRAPSLGDEVLALISGRGGREQVVLVDLRSRRPLPLPGLNRPDAQPLSVASDSRGERLALVRHRQGRTELVLYRRSLASLEAIPLQPDGVPRRVSLDPEGRSLAVEVSRDGLWQIDLISLP
jgi:hypothetical protein